MKGVNFRKNDLSQFADQISDLLRCYVYVLTHFIILFCPRRVNFVFFSYIFICSSAFKGLNINKGFFYIEFLLERILGEILFWDSFNTKNHVKFFEQNCNCKNLIRFNVLTKSAWDHLSPGILRPGLDMSCCRLCIMISRRLYNSLCFS